MPGDPLCLPPTLTPEFVAAVARRAPEITTTTTIFPYDFITAVLDRGDFSAEVVVFLCLYALTFPGNFLLLRGTHETRPMCASYGFLADLTAKFADRAAPLFDHFCALFRALPLAAVVGSTTFCVHGGIFSRNQMTEPGALDEINAFSRAVDDDADTTSTFNQLLWSDPQLGNGFVPNRARDCGILWGSRETGRFLEKNRLRFIIRSHESPEARFARTGYLMSSLTNGYAQDHHHVSGGAFTIYSAPEPTACFNGIVESCQGAVAVLSSPYDSVNFWTYAVEGGDAARAAL